MKTCGIFAASLFGALAAAAPLNHAHNLHHKRDVVWVTELAVNTVTVDVTATVWVGADQAKATSTASPTFNGLFAHQSKHSHRPSDVSSDAVSVSSSSVDVAPTTTSSVYVEPTTSSTSLYVEPTTSSTSVYVAPTTSSTSVYVEPTTSSTSVYVEPTTSSTSVYVEPTTSSTSVYVAPTTTEAPTSTYVAPSSTSSAPAATSSASSGSSSGLAASGTSYTGDVTYYDPGLGACGITSTSSDMIVAISQSIFDAPEYATANPNNNPLCGKYVSITGTDGSTHQAKVVDRCVGCAEADLDLTTSLFNAVAPSGDGRVHDINWTWV